MRDHLIRVKTRNPVAISISDTMKGRDMLARLLLLLVVAASSALALNNGLGRTPPMGWNTWCTDGSCGRDVCTSKEIMSVADAMEKNGMKDLGYEYINLDDCWADHRDADGTIVPDKRRFPEGLVPVIKYINAKGFKFGLYTDAGLYTCSSGQRPYKIPGSYSHYEQDAKTYADWGVEYVKMDWCNTDINGTQLDPKVQYPQMSKALNSTGKPIFFNACEWGKESPWEWMAAYANSWRSGPDHHDAWSSTSDIIERNADLGKYAAPGGWNDWDFLMTGGQGCLIPIPGKLCPGQTDEEYRTEFSLWSISNSALIVATDVHNLTDLQKEVLMNKEIIAVSQDKLGHAASRLAFWPCSEAKSCQIWGKSLSDGSFAVALYNNGTGSHDINLTFSLIGVKGTASVRDLWAHKDLGRFTNSFTSTVPSHGTGMYQIRQAA